MPSYQPRGRRPRSSRVGRERSSGRMCPTCGVNALSEYEARHGYQCHACTRRDEANAEFGAEW